MNEIVVQKIFKRYKENEALRGVSFEVKKGTITALLGPNGAGKSTLMRIICGIERASGGKVFIEGAEIDTKKFPLLEIGALLNPNWLDRRLTCEATLLVQSAVLKKALSKEQIIDCLKTVGLAEARKKKVSELSLGMKQRLALAVAFLSNPKILILDEPVNGLDPQGVRWIREFLLQFQRSGGTVLISSHLISEVSLIATDVVVLSEGSLKYSGPLNEIYQNRNCRVFFSTMSVSQKEELFTILKSMNLQVESEKLPDSGTVMGITSSEVFSIAARSKIVLRELREIRESLEESYFSLVNNVR